MDMKKIVICGGHFSPSLAVIEKLQKSKTYFIFYIGRKNPLEGDRSVSLEYSTISRLHIPFYSLICGRFQRSITRYTLISLAKFPIGCIQSLYFLMKIKPNIVLSFGGYVALPVCISAYILRIPVITHEQTSVMGLSNRIISKFAKIICLSWQNTLSVPKNTKVVVTGNPVRESVLSPDSNSYHIFGGKNLPLLFVTGGSLGSQSINRVIAKILPQLTSQFRIIHQCGSANGALDYTFLQNLKKELPHTQQANYRVVQHVTPSQFGSLLHKATLLITRCGANTLSEIASVGVPAIFIPLPWSGEGEQEQNAKILEDLKMGKIILQKHLTPDLLLKTLSDMVKNLAYYQSHVNMKRKYPPSNAADRIAALIDFVTKKSIQ